MTAKYFHITNGLRGMFMPDRGSTVRVFSMAALKALLEHEARYLEETHYGASKRAVARLAHEAWTLTGAYPAVMPLRPRGSDTYHYGLFVAPATKQEWQDYERETA